MNYSEKFIFNPGNCFVAQTIPNVLENGPINPDIGGLAVGLASIITNVVLPILLRWHKEHVQASIFMLLLQVYPILISTLASVRSGALSLFDAHFAIAITASPAAVYYVYSAFQAAVNRENDLFSNIRRGKRLMIVFGVLLPILWIALHITISFDSNAFRNSKYCKGTNFSDWLVFITVSNFVGVLDVMGRRDLWCDIQGRGGLGAISLIVLWIWGLYLVRHRNDICQEYRKRGDNFHLHSRIKRSAYLLWQVVATPWDVISSSHPWIVFAIVIGLHWSWILGIMKGIYLKHANVTYGQVLSIFSALPPSIEAWKLLSMKYNDLWNCIKEFPRSLRDGVCFCLFGEPNPWDHDTNHNKSTMSKERTRSHWRWILITFVLIVAAGLEGLWIFEYVKGGTIPTQRTRVNDPHSAWKPFSISLYVYGYCVGIISVVVWTAYFDHLPSILQFTATAKIGIERKFMIKSHVWRALLYFAHAILVLPTACFFCFGPLFAPFAALPLSQQFQWEHFCDRFPAEAILTGLSYMLQPSIASFYYHSPGTNGSREHVFDYFLSLNLNGSSTVRNLSYGGINPDANIREDLFPYARDIVFNLENNTMFGGCVNSTLHPLSDASATTNYRPCMEGEFTVNDLLTFAIEDKMAGVVTRLRAQDRQWAFTADAPSFILRYLKDDEESLGPISIQTAVTKRNHCDTLKVCINSGVGPGLDILAPLGLALIMQDRYAGTCMQPQIYTN